jgi:6-phosphogluconolactonase (cycloisomerase 2 family)
MFSAFNLPTLNEHAPSPHMKRTLLALFALTVILLIGALPVTPAAAQDGGAVYALTNEASGNQIAVYHRAADGTLTLEGMVSTDGLGTGAGLGSQGAVVLSANHQWLFAVNAGSHEISVFAVTERGLRLADKVGSGGTMPISLTHHGQYLYVLNAGGEGNITGFRVAANGALRPLPGSTQPLSGAGVGPAQVSFSPDGSQLIVTEKATNLIDVYEVNARGLASGPHVEPSAGVTPFGFAFQPGTSHLIVSEAFGGMPGASALSSYTVDGNSLQLNSASVPTTQTAACWVAIPANLPYAYTTNTGSGTVSSYTIAADGSISLLDAAAGVTGEGTGPVDAAISADNQYLYVRNGGTGTLDTFHIMADGSLVHLDNDGGLPMGAAGLAAR